MTKHEKMLARAKEAIDQVEKERVDYKGSCKECVHYQAEFLDQGICKQPIVLATSMLEDQGYNRTQFFQCDYQRSSYTPRYRKSPLCGPNGFLFERKPTFLESIKRFFR